MELGDVNRISQKIMGKKKKVAREIRKKNE